MVAEEAGVQRHTFYAHFPDERSLLMACSERAVTRDPPPDSSGWQQIADWRERLRVGLDALYRWYERNAELTACVLRDAEFMPLVREVNELRMGPHMTAYQTVLGEQFGESQRAVLRLALSFFTWRTLVRESGLDHAAAVEAMVRAID